MNVHHPLTPSQHPTSLIFSVLSSFFLRASNVDDYIEINPHWLSDTGNISRVANPINKRVRSTSLFIGSASLGGNISCIWKSMWFNQYITFFVTEHFKFISICFEVLRSLCWSIATLTYAKGYMKTEFLAPIFFWMDKVTSYWPLNRLWKREPVFFFCRNQLSRRS